MRLMARAPSLVWNGLKEFQAELKQLPADCQADAAKAIEAGAKNAFSTIAAVYDAHWFTGTLRKRLTLKSVMGGLVLTSGSPLAWLFDNGSQARHYSGTDKRGRTYHHAARGRMPATHIFARTVGQTRRTLAQQFIDLLKRRGAASVTVTKD